MARNKDLVDLQATSSFQFIKKFEAERQKIVDERKNYGVQVTTPNANLKNPQNKCKEGEVVTKMDAVKKRKNNFTDLQRQLDAIKKKKNPLPTTVEVNQPKNITNPDQVIISNQGPIQAANIPSQQLGNKRGKNLSVAATIVEKRKHDMKGEPLAAGLNTTKPTKMDENELKRKLDAIRKRGSIIPTTNAGQERSEVNSPQVAMNQVQQKKLQVAGKTISLYSQRQDNTNLPNSGNIPQVEVEDQEDTLEIDKSEQGEGKQVLRSTTIDEFLTENGINVDIEGLSTEPSDASEGSLQLNVNYHSHVMEDIDDEGAPKKKKTRGITTCPKIYGRTMEHL